MSDKTTKNDIPDVDEIKEALLEALASGRARSFDLIGGDVAKALEMSWAQRSYRIGNSKNTLFENRLEQARVGLTKEHTITYKSGKVQLAKLGASLDFSGVTSLAFEIQKAREVRPKCEIVLEDGAMRFDEYRETRKAIRVTSEVAQRLADLLVECNVASWKRHYEPEDYFVLDGEGWSLELTFEDGTVLASEGSNAWPEEFDYLKHGLMALFSMGADDLMAAGVIDDSKNFIRRPLVPPKYKTREEWLEATGRKG